MLPTCHKNRPAPARVAALRPRQPDPVTDGPKPPPPSSPIKARKALTNKGPASAFSEDAYIPTRSGDSEFLNSRLTTGADCGGLHAAGLRRPIPPSSEGCPAREYASRHDHYGDRRYSASCGALLGRDLPRRRRVL